MLIFLFVSNKGVTIHVGRYWYGSMHGIECIGRFLVTFVNIVVGAVVVWRAVLLLLFLSIFFCGFLAETQSSSAVQLIAPAQKSACFVQGYLDGGHEYCWRRCESAENQSETYCQVRNFEKFAMKFVFVTVLVDRACLVCVNVVFFVFQCCVL